MSTVQVADEFIYALFDAANSFSEVTGMNGLFSFLIPLSVYSFIFAILYLLFDYFECKGLYRDGFIEEAPVFSFKRFIVNFFIEPFSIVLLTLYVLFFAYYPFVSLIILSLLFLYFYYEFMKDEPPVIRVLRDFTNYDKLDKLTQKIYSKHPYVIRDNPNYKSFLRLDILFPVRYCCFVKSDGSPYIKTQS